MAHTILGVSSLAVTLGAAAISLNAKKWHITTGVHDLMGLVTLISAILLTIGGLISLLKRKM